MSTTLVDTPELIITRFYGGTDRGQMVEVYSKKEKRVIELHKASKLEALIGKPLQPWA